MKKFTLWLLMVFSFGIAYSQVVINQSFNTTTTPTNWTLGGGSITSVNSCATNSWRKNVYNATSAGPSLLTETQVSSGADLTISFNYKVVNWSAATVATDPYDGSITTEISLDNGTTWSVIAGVIDGTNHVPANTCANVNYVVPGASVPNGSNIKVRWNCGWVTGDYYVYIDDISITQPITSPPQCATITSQTNGATNVTNTAITWNTAAGGPNGYKLTIGTTSGGTDILNNVDLGNVTSYAGFNFSPNSTYYVKVVPYNAFGDATGCSEISFTTCASTTSFTQNFDALTTPALPGCWTKVGTLGSVYTQGSSSSSSPNTLYFYSSSSTSRAVIRLEPVSNLGAGTHRLRMKMRANFSVGGVVEIGYLTNPMDATTFTVLGSVTAASTTYTDYMFTPPSGTYSPYLALRHSGTPANSLLIDDVNWEVLPSCGEPNTLAASATSFNTATISWAAPTTAPSVGYEYVFSTLNTAPTAAGTATTSLNATVNSLTPNTTYYLYVRSNCGVDGFSPWIGPVSTTTLCQPETAPTTLETFSSATGTLPAVCWSEATGALAANTTLSGTTSGWTNTANFANNTAVANTAMRINLYGTKNDWIVSNPIDLGTTNTFRVKYSMAVTDYQGEEVVNDLGTHLVNVVVSTDGGATWSNANIVKTYSGANTYSNTGATDYAYLTGYSGVVKIGFFAKTTSTSPDIDFHVDNFVVELVPAPTITNYTSSTSCGTSTNITVTGTNLLNAVLTIGGTTVTTSSNTDTQITAILSSPLSGTLNVTTPGGSVDAANSFSFVNSPAFSISSSNTTICEGQSTSAVTIATGSTDYTTYQWTPSSNVSGDAVSGWVMNPTTTTEFVIEASNALGCSNSDTILVNVTNLPTSLVVAESSLSECVGTNSIEISAFGTLNTTSTYTQTTVFGTAIPLSGNNATTLTATLAPLPNGAVVTETKVVFNNVTTTALTYVSDLDVELTGASTIAEVIMANVNSVVTNAGPYQLIGSNSPVTGGTVTLTLTNNYSGPATIGNASIVVTYTLPDTADITWWTASTGGTLLGSNDTLETIGTSVLPTSTPGTYSFFAQAENMGCASSPRVEVEVTILNNTTSTVVETACGSFLFHGTTYNTSGTYTATIPNSLGCDSIITLNLTINAPSDQVTVSADQSICHDGTFNAFNASLDVTPSDSILIVGVLDGPLPGGLPKLVELYVLYDIPDLSIYGIGSASNGGGTDGVEFPFPAGSSATAGQFIRISGDSTNMFNFLGVYPQYTEGTASNNNGDDAIELFKNGQVIDVFGQIDVDGTGTPWEYLDGWAYRNSGSLPNGGNFDVSEWSFSGIDVFDGTTTNAQASSPYPLNSFVSNTSLGTITWYSDAALTNSVGTGSSYTPTNDGAGTQTLYVVHNNNGCDSDPVMVEATVLAIPVAPGITADGSLDICPNSEVTLTASNSNGIVWSNDSTSASIVVNDEGDYFVTFTDADGCSINSDTLTVSIVNITAPTISPAGPITLCENDEITLTSSSSNNIEWSNDETTASIIVSSAGTYFVSFTENGCTVNSNEVEVTVATAPTASATLANISELTATPAGMSYQWINCATETPIAGATSATYTATVNGSYAVIVTNTAGCSDTSDCINVTQLSVSDLDELVSVSLYPNPTSGIINFTMNPELKANALVMDAQGKVVIKATNIENASEISLANFENGVYMVQLNTANGPKMFRVVKQ